MPLIDPKLPYDVKLMRKVVREHLSIILLLLAMGLIFSMIGGATIYFGKGWDMWIFGGMFLMAGLAMLGFNAVSNYSSISYYYEKGLLKQYGKEVQATITKKNQIDSQVKTNSDAPNSDTFTERDCLIAFSYTFDGKLYESESFLDQQALFDWLSEGQKIPVLILPQRPEVAFPRLQKLRKQMKAEHPQTDESMQQNDIRISQDLMQDQEV